MNPITSLLLGIAGCLVLYYGSGRTITFVFESDGERRDMVVFVAIATAMLGVLAVSVGAPQ